MMTAEFLAEYERRVLNGARAYALSRQYTRTSARLWFEILHNDFPNKLPEWLF